MNALAQVPLLVIDGHHLAQSVRETLRDLIFMREAERFYLIT